MISLDNWAEIRHLRNEGLSIRAIAKEVGCAKRTVERALASQTPPSYKKRANTDNSFTLYEPLVRALLTEHPNLPATVLAERVGWPGSASWFRQNIARIRNDYLPKDPVDKLVHLPGRQIQCDLTFPKEDLQGIDGIKRKYPVLVMVSSYSRFMGAVVLPSRKTGDLLAGMWHLIETQFTAIPQHFLWDHETGIGQKRLVPAAQTFAGTLGCQIRQAPVRDPESKGVVERANQYLKTSFFPGRKFADVHDAQTQLDEWINTVANRRQHRVTRMIPYQAWQEDKAAMKPLSPSPTVGMTEQIRLPRNYYVTVDSNHYSVNPVMIGRLVTVITDLNTVTILSPEGEIMGCHRRCWAKHQTITDPSHRQVAVDMREHLRLVKTTPPVLETPVQAPNLDIYDRLVVAA